MNRGSSSTASSESEQDESQQCDDDSMWRVPHRPFRQFTGRQRELDELHALLTAAALFAMARGQGFDDATASLERLMGVECDRLRGAGVEVGGDEFFASPVVRLLSMYV